MSYVPDENMTASGTPNQLQAQQNPMAPSPQAAAPTPATAEGMAPQVAAAQQSVQQPQQPQVQQPSVQRPPMQPFRLSGNPFAPQLAQSVPSLEEMQSGMEPKLGSFYKRTAHEMMDMKRKRRAKGRGKTKRANQIPGSDEMSENIAKYAGAMLNARAASPSIPSVMPILAAMAKIGQAAGAASPKGLLGPLAQTANASIPMPASTKQAAGGVMKLFGMERSGAGLGSKKPKIAPKWYREGEDAYLDKSELYYGSGKRNRHKAAAAPGIGHYLAAMAKSPLTGGLGTAGLVGDAALGGAFAPKGHRVEGAGRGIGYGTGMSVGGGIGGLAGLAAYAAAKKVPLLQLLGQYGLKLGPSSSRFGGAVNTARRGSKAIAPVGASLSSLGGGLAGSVGGGAAAHSLMGDPSWKKQSHFGPNGAPPPAPAGAQPAQPGAPAGAPPSPAQASFAQRRPPAAMGGSAYPPAAPAPAPAAPAPAPTADAKAIRESDEFNKRFPQFPERVGPRRPDVLSPGIQFSDPGPGGPVAAPQPQGQYAPPQNMNEFRNSMTEIASGLKPAPAAAPAPAPAGAPPPAAGAPTSRLDQIRAQFAEARAPAQAAGGVATPAAPNNPQVARAAAGANRAIDTYHRNSLLRGAGQEPAPLHYSSQASRFGGPTPGGAPSPEVARQLAINANMPQARPKAPMGEAPAQLTPEQISAHGQQQSQMAQSIGARNQAFAANRTPTPPGEAARLNAIAAANGHGPVSTGGLGGPQVAGRPQRGMGRQQQMGMQPTGMPQMGMGRRGMGRPIMKQGSEPSSLLQPAVAGQRLQDTLLRGSVGNYARSLLGKSVTGPRHEMLMRRADRVLGQPSSYPMPGAGSFAPGAIKQGNELAGLLGTGLALGAGGGAAIGSAVAGPGHRMAGAAKGVGAGVGGALGGIGGGLAGLLGGMALEDKAPLLARLLPTIGGFTGMHFGARGGHQLAGKLMKDDGKDEMYGDKYASANRSLTKEAIIGQLAKLMARGGGKMMSGAGGLMSRMGSGLEQMGGAASKAVGGAMSKAQMAGPKGPYAKPFMTPPPAVPMRQAAPAMGSSGQPRWQPGQSRFQPGNGIIPSMPGSGRGWHVAPGAPAVPPPPAVPMPQAAPAMGSSVQSRWQPGQSRFQPGNGIIPSMSGSGRGWHVAPGTPAVPPPPPPRWSPMENVMGKAGMYYKNAGLPFMAMAKGLSSISKPTPGAITAPPAMTGGGAPRAPGMLGQAMRAAPSAMSAMGRMPGPIGAGAKAMGRMFGGGAAPGLTGAQSAAAQKIQPGPGMLGTGMRGMAGSNMSALGKAGPMGAAVSGMLGGGASPGVPPAAAGAAQKLSPQSMMPNPLGTGGAPTMGAPGGQIMPGPLQGNMTSKAGMYYKSARGASPIGAYSAVAGAAARNRRTGQTSGFFDPQPQDGGWGDLKKAFGPAPKPTVYPTPPPTPLGAPGGQIIPGPMQGNMTMKGASLELSPFAKAFVERCIERNMTNSQIKLAMIKAGKVHPDIAKELQPLLKEAVIGALTKGWGIAKGLAGAGRAAYQGARAGKSFMPMAGGASKATAIADRAGEMLGKGVNMAAKPLEYVPAGLGQMARGSGTGYVLGEGVDQMGQAVGIDTGGYGGMIGALAGGGLRTPWASRAIAKGMGAMAPLTHPTLSRMAPGLQKGQQFFTGGGMANKALAGTGLGKAQKGLIYGGLGATGLNMRDNMMGAGFDNALEDQARRMGFDSSDQMTQVAQMMNSGDYGGLLGHYWDRMDPKQKMMLGGGAAMLGGGLLAGGMGHGGVGTAMGAGGLGLMGAGAFGNRMGLFGGGQGQGGVGGGRGQQSPIDSMNPNGNGTGDPGNGYGMGFEPRNELLAQQ